jgi:hypothetical protein
MIESPLMTKQEAAQYLKLPVRTLDYRRCARKLPTWRKVGRNVFYMQCDLDEFLEKSRVCLDDAVRV